MSLFFWRKEFDKKFPNVSQELKEYIQTLVDEAFDKGHLAGYDEGLRDSLNNSSNE